MTPQELFASDPHEPRWVHARYIGVDQDDGLWIRYDAELEADLPARLRVFGQALIFRDLKEYGILTSNAILSVGFLESGGPAAKHVTRLTTGSIGPEWIAVV